MAHRLIPEGQLDEPALQRAGVTHGRVRGATCGGRFCSGQLHVPGHVTDGQRMTVNEVTAAATRAFEVLGNSVQEPADAAPRNQARRARARAFTRRMWVPGFLLVADLVAFVAAMQLTSAPTLKTLAVLLVILVLFHVGGLYRPRLSMSVLDDGPAIMGRALAAGGAAMVLGGLDDGIVGTSRLATCALFGVLALVTRMIAYTSIRHARRRHRLRQRTLLLGAGTVAASLAANLTAHPE